MAPVVALIVLKKLVADNAERERFRAIEFRHDVRAGQRRRNVDLRQLLVFYRLRENRVAHFVERRQSKAVDVLDLDGEAAGRTETGDRGRVGGQRRHARNLLEPIVEIVLQAERAARQAVAFRNG